MVGLLYLVLSLSETGNTLNAIFMIRLESSNLGPYGTPSGNFGISYPTVKYFEKGRIKRLGAFWDPKKKLWYFTPNGENEHLFAEWMPKPSSNSARAFLSASDVPMAKNTSAKGNDLKKPHQPPLQNPYASFQNRHKMTTDVSNASPTLCPTGGRSCKPYARQQLPTQTISPSVRKLTPAPPLNGPPRYIAPLSTQELDAALDESIENGDLHPALTSPLVLHSKTSLQKQKSSDRPKHPPQKMTVNVGIVTPASRPTGSHPRHFLQAVKTMMMSWLNQVHWR